MKEYYYLDKVNKIGPISEEELIKLNLKSDILIWEESLENWTKLSDIPELSKKTPPPPPEEYLVKNKKKSKKVLKSFSLLFALITLSLIITYSIINQNLKQSKKDLVQRVETIFSGKNIISDGTNYRAEGELERIRIEKEKKSSQKISDESFSLDFSLLKYPSEAYQDEELWKAFKISGYLDYYKLSHGGFSFKKITKIDNGYELEEIFAKNMLYKNNSVYRPSIQEAYTGTYDYIIEENENSYIKGAYNIIDNFTDLRSKYHYIANVKKPSYPYSDYWWYENMGVHNNYWKVFYNKENRYYEISLSKYSLKKTLIKLGIIELSTIVLIFLVFLIFNPIKW